MLDETPAETPGSSFQTSKIARVLRIAGCIEAEYQIRRFD
jgi:hypothetical protein